MDRGGEITAQHLGMYSIHYGCSRGERQLVKEGGKEGGRRGGLGESGGQGVLSSLPPRWVSFHPVKQPRSVGRGGRGGRTGVCGVSGGGRHTRSRLRLG